MYLVWFIHKQQYFHKLH